MKNLVWAVGALIIIIAAIFLLTAQNNSEKDTIIPSPISITSPSPQLMTNQSTQSAETLPFPVLSQGEFNGRKVRISTAKGDTEIELFADSPIASSNFIHLVNKGFYNRLTFHRVEPGFVVQGGDPKGDGTGGPGYSFIDEPVVGDYVRGVVAMANAGPNTNGSQFFIMLADAPNLPKQYTIFGKVVKGMDVVDKLEIGDVMRKAEFI